MIPGMPAEKLKSQIAYYSMEIALDPSIPSYGGGLGILAGDMLRSAADLELPMVAISLAYRKGYFRQHIDAAGNQTEEADPWEPESMIQAVDGTFSVCIENREVHVKAWRYNIHGLSGFITPGLPMLDTNFAGKLGLGSHFDGYVVRRGSTLSHLPGTPVGRRWHPPAPHGRSQERQQLSHE